MTMTVGGERKKERLRQRRKGLSVAANIQDRAS